MEENKVEAPALLTTAFVEMKVKSEIAKNKLSISDLEPRALEIVKNEDNLLAMAALLKDIDRGEEIALEIITGIKKPLLEASANCDAGKKLVFQEFERRRGMVKPDYEELLAGVDAKKQAAAKKAAADKAIKIGIEQTVTAFTQMIVTAANPKELSDVERRINLEKSSSREKKYGEFHTQAKVLYDEKLMPLIKSQKKRFTKLSLLHGQLEEAESDREMEEIDQLKEKIDVTSEEVKQIQAVAQDMLLNQDFFPVIEAEEVLPEIRVKRTDISFELADVAVALKKAPELLIIKLNNKAIRKVAAQLKKDRAFEGKDELIVDGIKYIVTRQREAL